MKQTWNMIFFVALLGVFCVGCGVEETIYIEEYTTEKSAGEQNLKLENVVDTEVLEADEETDELCYVYICGAVARSGVYQLPIGSRVCDVIAKAGGMTEDASIVSINQAEQIYDGQMIFLPTIDEAVAGVGVDILKDNAEVSDARVNINTASEEQLMTLSGIGKSKAADIIAYRDVHGEFTSIEEIMNVDGIKEGLYNRIKDDIRVK